MSIVVSRPQDSDPSTRRFSPAANLHRRYQSESFPSSLPSPSSSLSFPPAALHLPVELSVIIFHPWLGFVCGVFFLELLTSIGCISINVLVCWLCLEAATPAPPCGMITAMAISDRVDLNPSVN